MIQDRPGEALLAEECFIGVVMVKKAVNRGGFTLVELIVTLGILALIASIITPALSMARDGANNVICKSRLNTLEKAYSQYLSEHNERFQKGDTVSSTSCNDVWMMAISPYLSDKKAMFCPESSGTVEEGGVYPTMAWKLNSDKYYDPVRKAGMDKGSYCLNWWVNDADSAGYCSSYYWRNNQAAGADMIPILADGGDYTASVYNDGKDYMPSIDPIDSEMSVRSFNCHTNINRYLLKRHGDETNVMFMDGSVRSIRLVDLWSLNWHKGYKPVSADRVTWQWPQWLVE